MKWVFLFATIIPAITFAEIPNGEVQYFLRGRTRPHTNSTPSTIDKYRFLEALYNGREASALLVSEIEGKNEDQKVDCFQYKEGTKDYDFVPSIAHYVANDTLGFTLSRFVSIEQRENAGVTLPRRKALEGFLPVLIAGTEAHYETGFDTLYYGKQRWSYQIKSVILPRSAKERRVIYYKTSFTGQFQNEFPNSEMYCL